MAKLKKRVTFVITLGLSVYLLLFGLASRRYENKIDRFEKRLKGIYKQLDPKPEKPVLEIISHVQERIGPEQPGLFEPPSVVCAFFCSAGLDSEIESTLKNIIVSSKETLRGINLDEIDLSGSDTDLSHANLLAAKLRKARLRKTNLSHADLRKTDLREASLREADLSAANLREADLSGADLRKAKLSGADLRGVNLFYADLTGANLSEALLMGVTLSGADFRKANFFHADLTKAVLGGARLDGADLSRTRLLGSDLRYANLSETSGLTQDQMDHVLIDKNTTLPEGLKQPEK